MFGGKQISGGSPYPACNAAGPAREGWLMLCGVMAVDPGGRSGVAMGTFELGLGSVKDCMLEAREGGRLSSVTVDGRSSDYGAAAKIAHLWRDLLWCWEVEPGVRLDGGVALVMEDFVLRLGRGGAGGTSERVGLSPVRIAALVHGMLSGLMGEDGVVYQMPAAAKSYGTDARLRACGGWVKGREHERDAWRHVMLYLNGVLR